MLCLPGAKALSWCWRKEKKDWRRKKTWRENKGFGFTFDQTIIRERKRLEYGCWCHKTHTHTHTHTHTSAHTNPVGRPLILRHIYNLCNDNLIPPAGRGEHTPTFMLTHASRSTDAFVSTGTAAPQPLPPVSPGLRSADWYLPALGAEQE